MINSCSRFYKSQLFRQRLSEMGRKRNRRNKGNANNPVPYKTNESNYAQTYKENELFSKFYSGLGIMPPEEFQRFYNQLKEPLPVTFRITGYKSQANELLKIIRNEFFNKLINPSAPTASNTDTTAATTPTAEDSKDTEGQPVVSASDGAAGQGAAGDAKPVSCVLHPPMTIENVRPPKCLTWYPDELAWQIDLSRKALRSQEVLAKLHEFLISETETGNISRQEAVSMIPPLVLDIKSNSKVLDMCAAPGSKTAQLIEYLHKDENTVPEGFVIANDREGKRCYLMVHQVKRLASPCCMIVNHDASFFPNIRTNSDINHSQYMRFDRVLADVPCSGDGTMRKNVDIWKKWNPSNAHSLHGLQLKIVKRGLELLEVGGRLVYSTCSMHPAEDEAVMAETLRKCEGAVELVDISSYLPNFKTVPGLSKWHLMTKKGQVVNSIEEVPKHLLGGAFTKSMFPPTPEEAQKYNLHLCHRILPHHQDTGGFFVAALHKVRHLPWSKEARQEREAAKLAKEAEQNAQVKAEVQGDTPNPAAAASSDPTPEAAAATAPDAAAASTTAPAAVSEATEPNGDARKRKGDAVQGPPTKKKFWGVKEDPFLFLESNDAVWPPIKNFYGLNDDFPVEQLMYRCEQGPNRSLYFVNKGLREIVRYNDEILKFVNMGVKFVSRSPSPLVPDCDYRITQECMGSLSHLFDKRRVEIMKQDAIILFSEENPFLDKISPAAQERLREMSPGSLVFVYKPTGSNPDPACDVIFCGWRGKTSVRSFVPRHERSHSLRLFGQDLSNIQREVRRMKAERQLAWETKRREEQEKAKEDAAAAGLAPPVTADGDAGTVDQKEEPGPEHDGEEGEGAKMVEDGEEGAVVAEEDLNEDQEEELMDGKETEKEAK